MTICQTLHTFGIAQMCSECLADAMLALGGTQEDMHEFLMSRLPDAPNN